MKIGPTDKLRPPLDLISHQVKHLLRLMDDLLNLTRVTRGHIELRKTPLNLADNIADIAAQIQSQIEAGRHHLTLDLPEQPLYVEADPTRLTQIVFNLLSNAAHLRLVALSGFSLDEDAQQARQAGSDRCLLKPVSPGDLKAILREL
jgi:signal transduction histidine kinase